MFPNSKKNVATKSLKKGSLEFDSAVTILTTGCHFSGKLVCRGSTRIGGKIEGEIHSEGLLIIEEEAEIYANISAEEAIIQGSITGKMEARGRVELSSTSSFQGDIVTPSLIIHEGARFNGRSKMSENDADKEVQVSSVDIDTSENRNERTGAMSEPVRIETDASVNMHL